MPEFGTPAAPMIGGVPWNGSIYLDAPDGLSDAELLQWRLDYDLVWVMESLITIQDKATNKPIKFELNNPQRWAMWNLIEMLATGRPSWGWFLKGRQFGFSTLFITILFICALRGQNGLLLAHLEKPGRSIFRKPELALKSLPTFSITEEDEDGNARVMQEVSIATPPDSVSKETLMGWLQKGHAATLRRDSAEIRDAGVGETFQNAQITEAPLFPDPEHTIGYLIPALSRTVNTFVNGEFTARTEGDLAHKHWVDGLEVGAIFRSVFSSWYWHTPYADVAQPDEPAWTPWDDAYLEQVAKVGSIFPLTESGHLKPEVREVYDRNGRVTPDDLETGFTLSDGQRRFIRNMRRAFAGDDKKLRSEFPISHREAFRTAGRKLIPGEVMDVLDADARDPLDGRRGRGEYESFLGRGGRGRARWVPRRDGAAHRFVLPEAGATYLVWADPSSGTGVDPTGAGVYRVRYQVCELVMSFSAFRRPHEVARILARVGRHYRDGLVLDSATKKLVGGRPAEIVVERNNFGEAVITELQNLEYQRIWRYSDRSKDNSKHGHDYGFPTYKNTKNPMLQKFAQAAFDKQVVVPCRRMLKEMRAMQYLDDRDETIGAPRGQHDDLPMGGGIGFWAASEKTAFRFKPEPVVPEWLRERALFPNAG